MMANASTLDLWMNAYVPDVVSTASYLQSEPDGVTFVGIAA